MACCHVAMQHASPGKNEVACEGVDGEQVGLAPAYAPALTVRQHPPLTLTLTPPPTNHSFSALLSAPFPAPFPSPFPSPGASRASCCISAAARIRRHGSGSCGRCSGGRGGGRGGLAARRS
ncbi:unnamed protein product, partial [Closterium sp. NIES-54]